MAVWWPNNPCLAAVAQTQDRRNNGTPPKLDDIFVLSIGTGTNLSYVKGKNLDWGLAQWAKAADQSLAGCEHGHCGLSMPASAQGHLPADRPGVSP